MAFTEPLQIKAEQSESVEHVALFAQAEPWIAKKPTVAKVITVNIFFIFNSI